MTPAGSTRLQPGTDLLWICRNILFARLLGVMNFLTNVTGLVLNPTGVALDLTSGKTYRSGSVIRRAK